MECDITCCRYVSGSNLLVCGKHAYNQYHDCKDTNSYLCSDQINDVISLSAEKVRCLYENGPTNFKGRYPLEAECIACEISFNTCLPVLQFTHLSIQYNEGESLKHSIHHHLGYRLRMIEAILSLKELCLYYRFFLRSFSTIILLRFLLSLFVPYFKPVVILF